MLIQKHINSVFLAPTTYELKKRRMQVDLLVEESIFFVVRARRSRLGGHIITNSVSQVSVEPVQNSGDSKTSLSYLSQME